MVALFCFWKGNFNKIYVNSLIQERILDYCGWATPGNHFIYRK